VAEDVLASHQHRHEPRRPRQALTPRDTIAALASGRLPSAIAVIRISGPDAFAAATDLCGRLPAPRRAGLRRVRRADGAVLDEALVLAFPGPDSATGEDVAELHVHGSPAVVAAVLEALAAAGARPAEPGEFTRRAFDNGRIDLTQAEGLADLLAATTEAQRAQAAAQAEGALRRAADGWREALVSALAGVEAGLDFADEGDVADFAPDFAPLATVQAALGHALAGFAAGDRVREGLTVAIIGPPNAGKSSLLNALAGRDAAIVAATPGTTRDMIEVTVELGGLPVTLVDTAGLRETADPVEAEGVARAHARAAAADIVLAVSSPDARADPPPGAICVANKSDLGAGGAPGAIAVSALTGAGLDRVRTELAARARAAAGGGEPRLVTQGRQRDAVAAALAAVRDARAAADPVLAAESLRAALAALARLAGRADVEHVLEAVFSRFCIGK